MKYTVLFLLSLTVAQAQIKIGDITVSRALAREYFLDCQTHPDTVTNPYEKNYWIVDDSATVGATYSEKEAAMRDAEDERLTRVALGVFRGKDYRKRYVVPRTPSAADFAKWLRRWGR